MLNTKTALLLFIGLIFSASESPLYKREPLTSDTLDINYGDQRLNIEYMLRGYFVAGSQSHPNDLVGYARSENIPVEFPSFYSPKTRSAELIAFPDVKASFLDIYEGFKLVLANPTDEDIKMRGSDSRPSLVMQAKIEGEEWRDIEYLPKSWCGNSYHTLTLPTNKAWVFVAPKYHGEIDAKLRFVLRDMVPNGFRSYKTFRSYWGISNDMPYEDCEFCDGTGRRKKVPEIGVGNIECNGCDGKGIKKPYEFEDTIISNEFEGSINKEQFTIKQPYIPKGFDPYDPVPRHSFEAYDSDQSDVDEDGLSDVCDPCDNLVFTTGDVNRDGYKNIIDILMLHDLEMKESEKICAIEDCYSASPCKLGYTWICDKVSVLKFRLLVEILVGGKYEGGVVILDPTG